MDNSTKYRRVQPMVKPVARCSRNKKTKTAERSGKCPADDILGQRFVPYVSQNISGSFRKIERAFFTSLSNLCRLYDIPEYEYSGYYYPLNISTAYKETADRLKSIDKKLQLAIVYEQNANITLATYKTLDNWSTLYYVPVRPLFDLFKQERHRQVSALLLSVFAYLYRILKVPMYSHYSSYLHWVYELQWEYCTGDDDSDNATIAEYTRTIIRGKRCGDKLYKKIRGIKNLSLFGKRVKNFKAASPKEKEIKKIAKALYKIYQQFPEWSISASLSTPFLDPQAERIMSLDQYLSFIWDTNDCIIGSIIEHVNYDFEEAADQECPCSVQLFNKPQQSVTINLSFEQSVFSLIDKLVYCLTNNL